MWVMMSDAFLSIVWGDRCAEDELLVRARRPGDIDRVFPNAVVFQTTDTDYRYRAVVDRALVAGAMAREVMAVDYDNFKGSVKDKVYHDALLRTWGTMAALQPTPPYHKGRR